MPRCHNSKKASYYTGREKNPRGLGYCASCEKPGQRRKGRDGKMYRVSNGRWISVKNSSPKMLMNVSVYPDFKSFVEAIENASGYREQGKYRPSQQHPNTETLRFLRYIYDKCREKGGPNLCRGDHEADIIVIAETMKIFGHYDVFLHLMDSGYSLKKSLEIFNRLLIEDRLNDSFEEIDNFAREILINS